MSIKPRLQFDDDMSTADRDAFFRKYKKQCRTVARDFHYSKEVMDNIENATTIPQLERIMTGARQSF